MPPSGVAELAQRNETSTYRIEPCVARAAEATWENYARIAELLGGTEVEFNAEYGDKPFPWHSQGELCATDVQGGMSL